MHPRKTHLLAALAAVATFVASTFHATAQAPGPDPFGGRLFPPELIMNNADAIGLTQEQKEGVRDIVQAAQGKFGELQQKLKAEVDTLGKVSEPVNADQAVVLAQFDKVADREKEIKRAQLSMLLDLRKKLTEEQRNRLAEIRAKMMPPVSLREKADRVRAGASKWQADGKNLTPLAEIMQQVDLQIRAGRFPEAEVQLDKALKLLEGN